MTAARKQGLKFGHRSRAEEIPEDSGLLDAAVLHIQMDFHNAALGARAPREAVIGRGSEIPVPGAVF